MSEVRLIGPKGQVKSGYKRLDKNLKMHPQLSSLPTATTEK